MKYSLIIMFLMSLSGCDLFNTREAESPLQPRDSFLLAVTPEQLIDNFKNSYKDKNIKNYLDCFSDSSFSPKVFIYFPSSEASQNPSFAEGWFKKNEEQYFNNLKSNVSKSLPITVSFQEENSVQQGDSIIYTAQYSISIHFDNSSIPEYYEGNLKFFLSRDSRLVWVISSWWDYTKTKDIPTWSDLKGRLY